MRKAAFAICLILGCVRPHPAPTPQPGEEVDVLLIRGAADKFFSSGLDVLAGKLNTRGLSTITIRYQEFTKYSAPIIIGHSFGADKAIETARRRDGPVRLLVLFDPRFPGKVPANVDRCIEFMVRPPAGNGVPVKVESERTRIEREYVRGNHLSLDDDPALHDRVIQEIGR